MAALTMLFAGGACSSNDGTSEKLSQIGSMGRPLRRGRRRGFLLPTGRGDGGESDHHARGEYASVASFAELSLRLVAVGAPPELVAACHRAALDEVRHAAVTDDLAGRSRSRFGAVPGLLGRRIGGRRCSRRRQVGRIAVESYLDGWVNESAGAVELRRRAQAAPSPRHRAELAAMADDEQRHAELGRSIVTWCLQEYPGHVGRVLGAVAAHRHRDD